MRTTIDLDDELLRAVKSRAATCGQSMSALVSQAVRSFLEAEQAHASSDFELIEVGTIGGRCPSPGEVAALLEAEEIDQGA